MDLKYTELAIAVDAVEHWLGSPRIREANPGQAAEAVDTLVVRGIASPLSGGPHGLCCWSDRHGRG